MNDPFPCETIVDKVPCTGHATHVYRSAHATRLICDSCATAYRLAAKGPRKLAVVEFSLLELIPARSVLLGQIDIMKAEREAARENEQRAMSAANLAIEVKEKAMSETSEAWNRLDKMQQSLARAIVLTQLHREGEALVQRWVLWADATAILAAIITQVLLGGMAGWYVFAGGLFAAYWAVSFVVERWWVRPRLAQLNAKEAGLQ